MPLTPFVATVAIRLPAIGLVEIETVSDVAVESVTVPTAPLLKTTVLLPGVVSKPEPAMVSVVKLAALLVEATVTTGFSKATWITEPLETPLDVTTAVRFPAVGEVVILTVNSVAVAAETVPTAPLLNSIVLLLAVVSNPKPLMVMVVAFKARLAVLSVTTGFTSATCTAEPLFAPPVVTTAVKLPARVGLVESVTVSEVAVAAVTVPTAPKLKTTVLLLATVENPTPLNVTVVALAARLVALLVTTGLTVATCTAVPTLIPLTLTVAVRLPAVGFVENVTVSALAVALVTVPTAPLLKVTVLFEVVMSKPNPLIVSVVSSAARLAVLLVMPPVTFATFNAAPLEKEFVVTTAVRFPSAVGLTANVTVNAVAVADVTVPIAPLLKTTLLREAVVSKPKPLMTMVAELIARSAVLLVTTGFTVATCTSLPLAIELLVTIAVRLPTDVGLVEKVTRSVLAFAAVTVPTAPLLKDTVLFAAVASKPNP